MNSDEVHLGDVKFNPTTRELFLKDGQPAQLRNKSKDVLLYLARHPERTVTKDEIIEAVWSDVIVSDESLVQCIADIRRVIGARAKEILETVPREGYRLHVRARRSAGRRLAPALFATAALVVVPAWLIWRDSPGETPPEAFGPQVEPKTPPPGTTSTQAYLEVLQGRASASLFNRDESLVAERHFRRAIELDPAYARAHAELGTLFAVRFENDWTVLQGADEAKALYYAETAVELDPDLWLGHYALGRLHSVFGNLDTAEAHLQRAMSLQPENEDARAYFATVRIFKGDSVGGLEILEPALKSHPNPPYWYYLSLGNANFNLGRNEVAADALLKCLELSENSPYCMRYLIAVYGDMGRLSEGRSLLERYVALGFDPSIKTVLKLVKFQHPATLDRIESAYRLVGMPP